MNEIIDGLNTHTANTNNPHNVTAEQLGLATAYVYKGSVTNFSDLPTNAQNGWVYSVENEHTDSAGILHPAGANFAWNGSKWDDLGGSLSGYTKSVNSQSPDNKGNVNLTLVESLEKNTEDKLIVHNADGTTQELEVGKKYTINGKLPDSTDNYDINEYEGYWEAKENVSVGDVRFLKGRNNTKYLLECVQEGTTGTEQPTISDNTDLIDNTAKWGVRKLTKFQENSGIPVGFEYFSTNPNIPAGSIPLFGGEYSREVYSDLWSWVQEQAGYLLEESAWQEKSAANGGNVPFYSKGNGTTTFRVPSLKCWVKGANGIEEVGSYLSAGLPNITAGTSYFYGRGSGQAWGAFRYESTANTSQVAIESAPNNGKVDLSFDASRSNPIYGNSDTVQPKSIVGMWLVKAYGTVTNVGSTDVASVLSGIANAETRLSELANRTDVVASGDGYIRYNNGLQICYGEFTISSTWKDVTLPVPFKDTSYSVCIMGDFRLLWGAGAKSTSAFEAACTDVHGEEYTIPCKYIAIGQWK